MATKSYSKHKEFKEYSTKSTLPYGDEQFDMIKSELLPARSKLRGGGGGGSDSEYQYEYHEERHPTGKYERKDLHTVEQYTLPAKSNAEHNSYYYSREDTLPSVTTSHYENNSSSTPGYSRIKTKVTKDLSHNADELDSLLDDLQRDRERQLYKSGYTSDTAESSSFDYRKTSTPVKVSTAPSSGYSTLKTERVDNWTSSPLPPPPAVQRESEITREVFREEKTESRVVPAQVSPALPQPVPPIVCHQCHQLPIGNSSTLTRSGGPMNKVTTTVKTYTYEVPADQDPSSVPIPELSERRLEQQYLQTDTRTSAPVGASPSLGCQYCSHCSARVSSREYGASSTSARHASPPPAPAPAPAPAPLATRVTEHRYETTTDTSLHPRSERVVYPTPVNEVRTPVNHTPTDRSPANGHGPNGPGTYKWSETSYSAYNTTERHPASGGGPAAAPAPPAPPAPFPRPHTPSGPDTPKRLDDLLADFPDARFPTQPDGIVRRKVEVHHETSANQKKKEVESVPAVKSNSKNVAGPAVYYPPGHVPFQKKEGEYQMASASAAQGGGAYAAGRGMYEYESGAKSKEKTTERKAVVPVCLPLCCAMPCTIL